MPRLRYYISGHGLGHASRSCQIINTLGRLHPQLEVDVVSDAQPWFLAQALDPPVPVRHAALDIGVLQKDSLVMEEERTLQTYREFLRPRPALVAAETEALRRDGIDLVAADIPAAAFAAAHAAGIPAVGISNFSWDWIYEGLAERHPGYDDVLTSLRNDYRLADRLLRLPFHGRASSFAVVEELPLVVRRAPLTKPEVRRRLGIPPQQKLALISFGGFGLEEFASRPLCALGDWVFLSEKGLGEAAANLLHLERGLIPYPALVAAADAVVTKPGYGIVSEAIAHGTAVLYTHRGDFREQQLLIAALHRHTRALAIDNDSLRRGKWGPFLEQLLSQPQPPLTLATHGDDVAAARLAELAGD